MAGRPEHYTRDEVREALRPIASLTSKSEKARDKLAPDTWQHTMLGENVKALRLASALMVADASGGPDATPAMTSADREDALRALASMIERTEKAQAMFAPGTSQHSLARNRLKALRIAEAFVAKDSGQG